VPGNPLHLPIVLSCEARAGQGMAASAQMVLGRVPRRGRHQLRPGVAQFCLEGVIHRAMDQAWQTGHIRPLSKRHWARATWPGQHLQKHCTVQAFSHQTEPREGHRRTHRAATRCSMRSSPAAGVLLDEEQSQCNNSRRKPQLPSEPVCFLSSWGGHGSFQLSYPHSCLLRK
jgi:hypothetical protein